MSWETFMSSVHSHWTLDITASVRSTSGTRRGNTADGIVGGDQLLLYTCRGRTHHLRAVTCGACSIEMLKCTLTGRKRPAWKLTLTLNNFAVSVCLSFKLQVVSCLNQLCLSLFLLPSLPHPPRVCVLCVCVCLLKCPQRSLPCCPANSA